MKSFTSINQPNQQLVIFLKSSTQNKGQMDFNFIHSLHSFQRAAQRGISKDKLKAALQYGEVMYKQGLLFFILGENNIPDSLLKDKNKLQNIVVVVSGASNEVITCYRSAHPFRHIKMKSKKLNKPYSNAA